MDEILGPFGWSQQGPTDQDWPCCKKHPLKQRKKPKKGEAAPAANVEGLDATIPTEASRPGPKPGRTHSTDMVIRYDDPYSDAVTLLNTDLKSFAAASINKASLGGAIRSLCNTINCADVSPVYRERYAQGSDRWNVHGLLFIYNHADDYADGGFAKLLGQITPANVRAPLDKRVLVLGPADIKHLHVVARDLRLYKGDHPGTEIRWFTPDLVMKKAKKLTFGRAAPIEALLGPWQVAGVIQPGQTMPSRLRLYYRCKGVSTTDEFQYLIEFLFRHSLIDHDIDIKLVGAAGGVLDKFEAAINNAVEHLYGLQVLRDRLSRLRPEVLSEFQVLFSSIDIGMERRS